MDVTKIYGFEPTAAFKSFKNYNLNLCSLMSAAGLAAGLTGTVTVYIYAYAAMIIVVHVLPVPCI